MNWEIQDMLIIIKIIANILKFYYVTYVTFLNNLLINYNN